MRRLPRILLNAATVLSLVLCVATVAAWVRSYFACDIVWCSLANPRLLLQIATHRGGLSAEALSAVGNFGYLIDPGTGWVEFPTRSYAQVFWRLGHSRTGFTIGYMTDEDVGKRYLACPYWFIMLLTAILPVARLAGWRRRRARRLGMRPTLCRHCGYDCRATPERCPECGTARVTAAAPAREGKGETEGV